ncbi:MAG: alpha/beta fold hydrolase [Gemmobacter sp.]|nr:alpha/beta fold hydrolase [Gemmobacter sp.]
MTSDFTKGQSAHLVQDGHRAEIVDWLYEVALNPVRLEDLLDVWEGHVSPLRAGTADKVVTLDDPEIATHLGRASVFLDRFEATDTSSDGRAAMADIHRSAAFVSDGEMHLTAANRAAQIAFGLSDGMALTALPFDEPDIATLRGVIRKVVSGRDAQVVTLRIRHSVNGGPVILRISPVGAPADRGVRKLALVVSTELVWPEGFETTVQDAFGLTMAEVEIVRGITLGLPIKDIADARGRSPDTVRTQVRSILSKTETHSQSELVRIVLGLMDLSLIPSLGQRATGARGGLVDLPVHSLTCADGRRLDWLEFGAPGGKPVLYMHLDFGLVRWPAAAEQAAAARGMRIIVPMRAGYGKSSPLAAEVDHLAGVAQDYAAVLDHLGLSGTTVLALGADLRFAMHLSIMRPDLVKAILGCAAQLPLRSAAQYERMDKWQRFILANARYAPRVLPFLVKAGFSLARKLGKERFFEQVNGGSPADMAAFSQADIREAILCGSEILMSDRHLAHEAFAQECLGSERDWSAVVRAVKVPVRLLQGDQDPQTPALTIRELMEDFPHLDVEFVPGSGQLLFFAHWQLALAELTRLQNP